MQKKADNKQKAEKLQSSFVKFLLTYYYVH